MRAAVCGCASSWRSTYTGCQHSTLFLLNDPTQFFCVCFAIYFWRYCGPFLHEFDHEHYFLSQRQLLLAFWQADNGYLNLLSLFREYVCIHCIDCSLVSVFTNETQVPSPVTRMMWLRNSSPSLWYRSKKSAFYATREHFRNPSFAKLVIT
jgi:hypothetical protein